MLRTQQRYHFWSPTKGPAWAADCRVTTVYPCSSPGKGACGFRNRNKESEGWGGGLGSSGVRPHEQTPRREVNSVLPLTTACTQHGCPGTDCRYTHDHVIINQSNPQAHRTHMLFQQSSEKNSPWPLGPHAVGLSRGQCVDDKVA